MVFASVTFILSGLGIMGMFFLKSFELKTGKNSVLGAVSLRTNDTVRGTYYKTRSFLSYFNFVNMKLAAGHAGHLTIVLIKKVIHKIEDHLNTHHYKILDMLRGKGGKKGSVSFFLQRIAEDEKKEENL